MSAAAAWFRRAEAQVAGGKEGAAGPDRGSSRVRGWRRLGLGSRDRSAPVELSRGQQRPLRSETGEPSRIQGRHPRRRASGRPRTEPQRRPSPPPCLHRPRQRPHSRPRPRPPNLPQRHHALSPISLGHVRVERVDARPSRTSPRARPAEHGQGLAKAPQRSCDDQPHRRVRKHHEDGLQHGCRSCPLPRSWLLPETCSRERTGTNNLKSPVCRQPAGGSGVEREAQVLPPRLIGRRTKVSRIWGKRDIRATCAQQSSVFVPVSVRSRRGTNASRAKVGHELRLGRDCSSPHAGEVDELIARGCAVVAIEHRHEAAAIPRGAAQETVLGREERATDAATLPAEGVRSREPAQRRGYRACICSNRIGSFWGSRTRVQTRNAP